MGFQINPFTSNLDKVNSNPTVTGDVDFGTNCIILTDGDSVRWCISVDTDGALVTTAYTVPGTAGSPIGLLLALTYS